MARAEHDHDRKTESIGAECPECHGTSIMVTDSRKNRETGLPRRRRQCHDCGIRFTTYEVVAADLRDILAFEKWHGMTARRRAMLLSMADMMDEEFKLLLETRKRLRAMKISQGVKQLA